MQERCGTCRHYEESESVAILGSGYEALCIKTMCAKKEGFLACGAFEERIIGSPAARGAEDSRDGPGERGGLGAPRA